MPFSTPSLETHLETQAVLYPTLRYLVRLLPMDHRRVRNQLQEEAKYNPFLLHRSATNHREALLEDVLPEWYTPAAPEPNLQVHLAGQISALSLPLRQQEALIYLTHWLSPSGYLEDSPETWAGGSQWNAEELAEVVPVLQSLDPPGIGARSLQECLLLQLRDQPHCLATILVQNHLEAIADCVGKSAQATLKCQALLQLLQQANPHISLHDLKTAIQQIQALEPRPARNFSHSPAPIITPDLKAEPQINGWQLSLAYEVNRDVCLNQEAIALLTKSNRKSREVQRLESLLQKAHSILTALNQWQENLLKVGQFLCDHQSAFLESKDSLDLVPTPQQMVAQAVGLSNATVSRIVQQRHLLINGHSSKIVPLKSLCTSVRVGGRTSQQVQQLIQQLIQAELPTEPYTDDQLAQLLKLRFGLAIARRTVVKYRQLAGIEGSFQRKLNNPKISQH
ncbi:RNA polymerase subunit sigma-54 [Nostoc sp. TCL240-02]|uniref:RNA polymerase factor sigma-54 n=1 Tax=Nostoc sp. TCL240-02 TaxID=2572090 RepID=UPI00157FA89D|nr:RNA polymerase subunit sigma-54 [Nostoc sp. TCL240-02]QKQ73157.1 RNA polymerase subunit sigma-54 [Nostoc sp. TCL240-02]